MIRVAAVQCEWTEDPPAHRKTLEDGSRWLPNRAPRSSASRSCTLSPYFAIVPDDPEGARTTGEDIGDGPTTGFAREMAAETGAVVHASLYERDPVGIWFNTAIAVDPDGRLRARTRKIHIPEFPNYHENEYFAPR